MKSARGDQNSNNEVFSQRIDIRALTNHQICIRYMRYENSYGNKLR